MPKTNALPDSRPVFSSPDSKTAQTTECVSPSAEHSGSEMSERPEFGASEIAALRAFFELLDQWERKEKGE
jgi:hypothetical protein